MTIDPVLKQSPKITAIKFTGLNGIVLPITSKSVEGYVIEDNPLLSAGSADNEDKYFLKSITGLEPPDQAIAIAKTRSGGKYQGKTVSDREIVVLLGVNPDEDAGETPKFLRDQLYTMINSGYDPKIRIELIYGIFTWAYIDAYVSKFEASLSDANPMIQITFTCLNPTFSGVTEIKYEAEALDSRYPNVYNPGTAETGFKFSVKFTGDMDRWFIKQAAHQEIGMFFKMDFHANDVLSVSTIPGNRYVHWKKHRGKVRNKMGILRNDYEWVMLHPGMNNFVVPKKDNWLWKGNLAFTAQYWGG